MIQSTNTSNSENSSLSYNSTLNDENGVWFESSTLASFGSISDDRKVFNYIMCAVAIFILIMVAAIVKGLHIWHRRSQSSQRRKSNASYSSHDPHRPASTHRQAWVSVKKLGSSLLHIGSDSSVASKTRARSKTGRDGGRRPTAAKNVRRPATATVVPSTNPTTVQPASKDMIIWKTAASANMATTANLFHQEGIESKQSEPTCNIRDMNVPSTTIIEEEEPFEGQVATVYTQEQIAMLDILSNGSEDVLALPPIDVASTSLNPKEETIPNNPDLTNNIDDFLAKLESQLGPGNVVDFSRTVTDVKAPPPTDTKSISISDDSLAVFSLSSSACCSSSTLSSSPSELLLRVRSASDVSDHRRRAKTPIHLVDSDFEFPFLTAAPCGKDPFSHPTPSRRPTSSLCNLYDGRSILSVLSNVTSTSSTIVDVDQTSYNLSQPPPIARRTAPRHHDDMVGKRLAEAQNDVRILQNRSPTS